MLKRPALLALFVLAASQVQAVELRDSRFEVTYSYAGYDERFEDAKVPLLPENACYAWYVQLGAADKPTSVVERLVLPEPLADWGSLPTDPDDGVEISEDRTTAISTLTPTPDADGWITAGWCVAAGDPVGAHHIEVEVDGAPLTTFDFYVLAPEDYDWPSVPQPDPMARSVYNSW